MDVRYERQLKRGLLEIIVLKLLSQGRAYATNSCNALTKRVEACSASRKERSIPSCTVWKTTA